METKGESGKAGKKGERCKRIVVRTRARQKERKEERKKERKKEMKINENNVFPPYPLVIYSGTNDAGEG